MFIWIDFYSKLLHTLNFMQVATDLMLPLIHKSVSNYFNLLICFSNECCLQLLFGGKFLRSDGWTILPVWKMKILQVEEKTWPVL